MWKSVQEKQEIIIKILLIGHIADAMHVSTPTMVYTVMFMSYPI